MIKTPTYILIMPYTKTSLQGTCRVGWINTKVWRPTHPWLVSGQKLLCKQPLGYPKYQQICRNLLFIYKEWLNSARWWPMWWEGETPWTWNRSRNPIMFLLESHVCMHVYVIVCVSMFMYAYLSKCMYACVCVSIWWWSICTHMYVCTCVSMFTYVYIRVCMRVPVCYIYVHVDACICLCMHACIYI